MEVRPTPNLQWLTVERATTTQRWGCVITPRVQCAQDPRENAEASWCGVVQGRHAGTGHIFPGFQRMKNILQMDSVDWGGMAVKRP